VLYKILVLLHRSPPSRRDRLGDFTPSTTTGRCHEIRPDNSGNHDCADLDGLRTPRVGAIQCDCATNSFTPGSTTSSVTRTTAQRSPGGRTPSTLCSTANASPGPIGGSCARTAAVGIPGIDARRRYVTPGSTAVASAVGHYASRRATATDRILV
jgi:hypothetical protein